MARPAGRPDWGDRHLDGRRHPRRRLAPRRAHGGARRWADRAGRRPELVRHRSGELVRLVRHRAPADGLGPLSRPPAAVALAVAFALLALSIVLQKGVVIEDVVYVWLLAGGAWLGGRTVAGRTARAELSEQRAAAAEQQAQWRAAAAVAEERLRIAREMHDVVSHSLSVMTLHVSGLRRLLRPDQEAGTGGAGDRRAHRPRVDRRDAPPARRAARAGHRAPAPGLAGSPAARTGPRRRAAGRLHRHRRCRRPAARGRPDRVPDRAGGGH